VLRRRLIIAAIVLSSLGVLVVLWVALGWPPPHLLARHGLPPAGGPTGRTTTVAGIEFVEMGPGYCRIRHFGRVPGNGVLGVLRRILGFGPEPEVPFTSEADREDWAHVKRRFWISRCHIERDMTGSWPERAHWHAQRPYWQIRFAKWLTQVHPGSFRVARLEEVLLASEFQLTPNHPERVWVIELARMRSGHHRPIVFPTGPDWDWLQTGEDPMHVTSHVGYEDFRLVWMPAEDE